MRGSTTSSYTRGLDLSGSLQGAGGIGGLLARSESTSHAFYHADANGNVTYLMNSDQTLGKRYTYDPYGAIIQSSGSVANPFCFSSKEYFYEYSLSYYGYRFYSAYLQRWLNRDPLGTGRLNADSTGLLENTVGPFEFFNGNNLYHYVYNNPINLIDPNGLDIWVVKDDTGWGHETLVGDNGDGTYWDNDKMPGSGIFNPLVCDANIRFNEKSNIDPRKEMKSAHITHHLVTTPDVDRKVKDFAESNRRCHYSKYVAMLNDCRHYARAMYEYAIIMQNEASNKYKSK
jgi:RHS repeat-associated protein